MPTEYCRHIHANGKRCRSLALAGKSACYWHNDLKRRLRHLNPTDADLPSVIPDEQRRVAYLQGQPLVAQYYGVPNVAGPLQFSFPALEDRESIQVALSLILSALGQDRIDVKRATGMLYCLQVASINAANLQRNPRCIVRDTVVDGQGAELALDEDPEEVVEERQLFEVCDDEDDEDEV